MTTIILIILIPVAFFIGRVTGVYTGAVWMEHWNKKHYADRE